MQQPRAMAPPSPFGTLNIAGNASLHSQFPPPLPIHSENGGPSSYQPLAQYSYLGPPPSSLGRRVSVSAESIEPSSSPNERPPPFFQKTADQMNRLKDATANAFLFRNLDTKKRNAVLGAMKEIKFRPGVRVITQGDDGDFFYAVDSGTLECFVHKEDQVINTSEGDHREYGKKAFTYTRGTTFGELALMYYAKRAATIVTNTDCTLWALDRLTFQTILLDITHRTRKSYEGFLKQVPVLQSLTDQERAKLADVLQAREFEAGETVIEEGDLGREFYLVEEGEAIAFKKEEGPDGSKALHYSRGDYFGELALLHRDPRAATVRATTKLKVAALDADAFTRLLGPLRDIMERNAELKYHGSR